MNEKLHEYAALLIRIGLNIQKGQRLVISSPVECAYFARLCAEEAYAAGCREVVMNWHDDAMARLKYLHADDEIFDTVPCGGVTSSTIMPWKAPPTWPSPPRTPRTSAAWSTAGSSGRSRLPARP